MNNTEACKSFSNTLFFINIVKLILNDKFC